MIGHSYPPVSLFRLFNRMGGWIVIILGVFMVLITLVSQLALSTARQFEREGVMATAQVSEKYTTTSTDSDGDTRTTYWLAFTYVTATKEEITQTKSVGTSLYRRVEPGESFTLLYLQSDPRQVETTPGSNRTTSYTTQIMALVFGLVWLAGVWIVGRWTVAGTRARKYGVRHTVRVTEVRRSNVRINNRPRYRLIWDAPGGGEGRSLLQRKAWVEGIKSGDEIDIYQGLKSGWWVGDVGERNGQNDPPPS